MNGSQRSKSLLLLAVASALLATCGGGSTSHDDTAPTALPFIQDDYSQALTEARERKLPLFIETWAPW